MPKIKYALLIFTMVIFSQLVFGAAFPTIETDQQKLQYGIWVRKVLPKMFLETFNYYFDFWKLMEDQNEVNKNMPAAASDYQHPFLVLTINDLIQKKVATGKSFRSWQSALVTYVQSLPPETTKQSLMAEVKNELIQLKQARSGDLMSSLIMTAVPDKKMQAEAFKLGLDGKIKLLQDKLPENLGQTDFNAKKFGIEEKNISKTDVLNFLKKLLTYEDNVSKILFALVASADLDDGAGLGDLKNRILGLSIEEFRNLGNEDIALTALQKIYSGSAGLEDLMTSAVKLISNQVKAHADQNGEMASFAAPRLRLVEVPAWLGILRSAVGSDCSHSCSFSMADNPLERVFFIEDAVTGDYKGYVQGTTVDSENGLSLFVTSVEGKSMTTAETEDTLNILFQSREALGLKQIVTLKSEAVTGHFNFSEPRKFFENFAKGKKPIKIWSPNPDLQGFFDKFVTTQYDQLKNNTEAIVFSPSPSRPANISYSISQQEVVPPILGPVDPKDAFLFSLEIDSREVPWSSGKRPITAGERAANAAGINFDEYREARNAFTNMDKISLVAFYARIRRVMAKHGITVDDAFIKDHTYLFYEGHLLADDAFTPEERARSMGYLVQISKANVGDATDGLKEIGKNTTKVRIIEQDKEFQEKVLGWLDGNGFDQHTQQARKLISMGIALDFFKRPDITKKLIRSMGLHPDAWQGAAALVALENLYPNVDAILMGAAKDTDPVVRKGVLAAVALSKNKVYPRAPRGVNSQELLMAAAPDGDPGNHLFFEGVLKSLNETEAETFRQSIKGKPEVIESCSVLYESH